MHEIRQEEKRQMAGLSSRKKAGEGKPVQVARNWNNYYRDEDTDQVA